MNAPRRLSPPRAGAARRAAVGAAWALAWTLVWGSALMLFAGRAHAAPLTLAAASGPVSLPIYVAQARGFFRDEGLELRLRDCDSGRTCYRWLADGQVDVATAAELQVATGARAHPDLAIFATICASSSQVKLVARRSARIAEAPQLRGKRVGTVPGSSAQYFLDSWLVYNDIDPATVTVVGLPPERLVDALRTGQVDAIAIWEPLAASAMLTLGGDAVQFGAERVYTQHFNLVAARRTLQGRDAEVAGLLRALIRAQDLIRTQPAAVRALLAERLHLPPAVVADAIDGQDYRVRLDQSLVTTMQSEARWAARAVGTPRGGVDVAGSIATGPLARLDNAAVGMAR